MRVTQRVSNRVQQNGTSHNEAAQDGIVTVLGGGQSLMQNWGSTSGLFNQDGDTNANATLQTRNSDSLFINAGDGSSCLLRSTCISTSQDDQDDYWIDDCGYYASGTAPWNGTTGVKSYYRGETAVLPTRGAKYTAALGIYDAARASRKAEVWFLWSQLESETGSLTDGSITQAQVQAGMQTLWDFFREDFPRAQGMHIRPLGRRADGNSYSIGFERARNAQRNFAAANPASVFIGAEAYDLPMYNDTLLASFTATSSQTAFDLGLSPALPSTPTTRALINDIVDVRQDAGYTRSGNSITFSQPFVGGESVKFYVNDSIHRSPNANVIEAKRAMKHILAKEGSYRGNTIGPIITAVSYDGEGIICTIEHDKASSLKLSGGSAYTDTIITGSTPNGGQFLIETPTGEFLTVAEVKITGRDTIKLLPQKSLTNTGTHTLYTGYGDYLPFDTMASQVDTSTIVLDNDSDNALPLRGGSPKTFVGLNTLPANSGVPVVSPRTIKMMAADYTSIAGQVGNSVVTGRSMSFPLGSIPNKVTSALKLKSHFIATTMLRNRSVGKRYTYDGDAFTATAGQTVFTLSYTPSGTDYLKVTKNNRVLTITTDYTVSGANVTLTAGATAGDVIRVYPDSYVIHYSNAVEFPDTVLDYSEEFEVTLTGTTATATVDLVNSYDQARSFISFMPFDECVHGGSGITVSEHSVVFASTTQLTVTVAASAVSGGYIRTIRGRVGQIKAAALKQLVPIDITIASATSSNTQALGVACAVDNTALFFSGYHQTGTLGTTLALTTCALKLTTTTAGATSASVTALKGSSSTSRTHRVRGYLVELNAGYWTVQHKTVSLATLTAHAETALSSVNTNKTFILNGGWTSNSTTTITSVPTKDYRGYLSLAADKINLDRIDSGSVPTLVAYPQAVSFP